MFDRLLIVWLTAISALAWFWPGWFPSLDDPFLGTTGRHLDWLFAATMFAVGWMLPHDEIRQVRQRWPMVLAGTALQYSSMPLLAWSIGLLLGLDDDARLGLLLVGCVPDAMASGVLTLAARGNVSYAVSLTTASTLLAPLIVPTALELFLGEAAKFDALGEARKLALTVVLPVVGGHMLGRLLPSVQRIVEKIAPAAANGTILWIIACVAARNRNLELPGAGLIAALLLVNVLGYAAGYYGGRALRLPEPMTRALSLVVGMQNAGLGTVIALRVFETRPAVAVPSAIYTLASVYTALVLAFFWSRRSAAAEAPSASDSSEQRESP
jgi:BASS family bile acid:Na+ symporter